ncbi:hypothetical protein MLD38_038079 [Melastoma candidum]|uniref:Uncharacterized protein n=1 Tax=Melastoma candidum TaxID=119954 RepID=A0ACB9KYX9_9MYRT|nr:hypothetical protein MLD38_038079 [Melastoma candidum]
MAAIARSRMFQRRLFSLVSGNRATPLDRISSEGSMRLLLTQHGQYGGHYGQRWVQTLSGSNEEAFVSQQTNTAESSTLLVDALEDRKISSAAKVDFTAISNLKTSSRHDLAMVFTCKVCETRSVKTACRESYEKGVVVVRCSGCDNYHLIADRLGMFGQPGSVEDFLAARGEDVKKGSMDTLNLTLEDLAGKRP